MEVSADWILDGSVDWEYKKYRLLAYFQRIDKALNQVQLWPHLPQLRRHSSALSGFQERKTDLQRQFSQNIAGIDLRNLRLRYEKPVTELPQLNDIEQIIDFALPKMTHRIAEATDIAQMVEQRTVVYPVGIVPLYRDEGYLMFRKPAARQTVVFNYVVPSVQLSCAELTIQTHYITTFAGTQRSLEKVKQLLIRKRPELPNPAAYAVESELEVPVQETLVPVASKLLGALLNKKWEA